MGTPHEWTIRDVLIGPSAGPTERPTSMTMIVGATITIGMDHRAAPLDRWTARSTPAT